jgi:hypothetical protein
VLAVVAAMLGRQAALAEMVLKAMIAVLDLPALAAMAVPAAPAAPAALAGTVAMELPQMIS